VRFLAGAGEFLSSQTCPDRHLGPTHSPVVWVSGAYFPRVKQPELEADHVLVPRLRISGAKPPLLPIFVWRVQG